MCQSLQRNEKLTKESSSTEADRVIEYTTTKKLHVEQNMIEKRWCEETKTTVGMSDNGYFAKMGSGAEEIGRTAQYFEGKLGMTEPVNEAKLGKWVVKSDGLKQMGVA